MRDANGNLVMTAEAVDKWHVFHLACDAYVYGFAQEAAHEEAPARAVWADDSDEGGTQPDGPEPVVDEDAPGCHSRPYWDPPMIGWVLTKDAAEALANVSTHMPGGTSHRRTVIWDRPDQ